MKLASIALALTSTLLAACAGPHAGHAQKDSPAASESCPMHAKMHPATAASGPSAPAMCHTMKH